MWSWRINPRAKKIKRFEYGKWRRGQIERNHNIANRIFINAFEIVEEKKRTSQIFSLKCNLFHRNPFNLHQIFMTNIKHISSSHCSEIIKCLFMAAVWFLFFFAHRTNIVDTGFVMHSHDIWVYVCVCVCRYQKGIGIIDAMHRSQCVPSSDSRLNLLQVWNNAHFSASF